MDGMDLHPFERDNGLLDLGHRSTLWRYKRIILALIRYRSE